MTEITFKSDMDVELVDSMGTDETVARAARVSTGRDQLEQGKIEGLIGYLVREGHCYDPKTEILTRDRGWVPFPEVTLQDKVLSRTVSGEMNWEAPLEIINEQYEGPMVHLSGRNLDLVVTPNHRMLAEHRTKQGWQPAGIHRAYEFNDRTYRVYRGGGVKEGVNIPENIAKLLGFVIADAHVDETSISFHLKKPRKIRWLSEITEGRSVPGANDTFRVPLGYSKELTRLARMTYDDAGNRVIPSEVLAEWSSRSIGHLLEGFLEGDGHKSPNGQVTASTVSGKLADQLQQAAALSGGAATVTGPHDRGGRSVESGFAKTYKPIYQVGFASSRHLKVRVGWTHKERREQVQWKPYKGTIHCVTVPSGVVYVRRNGKTLWSGNSSTLEHCTVTVRVHVPVFVHRQLMTHRTLSKNSESGRYKELEPVFYVPSADRPLVNVGSGAHPNLSHKPELYEDVRVAHENLAWKAWSEYRALVESGVATEVARNVLPVSIYTSAYLTGNLLGWFNFLRLRNGDHGAPQYEIVEVAKKVEAVIEDLYPITYNAWKEVQKSTRS